MIKHRKNRWICLLTVMTVVAGLILLVVCWMTPEKRFTPPPRDPSAQTGMPVLPGESGFAMADCGRFSVGLCANPICENGGVMLWLTNPAGNPVWLRVRLYDENAVLRGESGLILPGEHVPSIAVDGDAYHCVGWTAEVLAYEPETYHSMGLASFSLGGEEGSRSMAIRCGFAEVLPPLKLLEPE